MSAGALVFCSLLVFLCALMVPFGGVTGCSESSPVVIKVSTKGNRFLMVHRFAALGGAGMGLWGGLGLFFFVVILLFSSIFLFGLSSINVKTQMFCTPTCDCGPVAIFI